MKNPNIYYKHHYYQILHYFHVHNKLHFLLYLLTKHHNHSQLMWKVVSFLYLILTKYMMSLLNHVVILLVFFFGLDYFFHLSFLGFSMLLICIHLQFLFCVLRKNILHLIFFFLYIGISIFFFGEGFDKSIFFVNDFMYDIFINAISAWFIVTRNIRKKDFFR